MGKGKWAIWGPLGEGGSCQLGLGAKGGAHPPLGRRTFPPWEFSPTWGRGGGSHHPLAYIRRGRPPFSVQLELSLSLSFSYLERTPLVWSLHLVGSSPPKHVVALPESVSVARLVRILEGTMVALYVCNLLEALHLWCYFIAGGQPGVSIAGDLLHDREVIVLTLR